MQTRSLFRSLKIPAHLTRAAAPCALVAALALLAVGGGERVALVSEARAQAGGNDPQEDEGGVTNPADCIETELVWTEERDSDANSLIRDYFFPYPEGIRVSNRCSNTVSVRLGADATLEGIVESVTDDAVHYTPDLTSEDVLECESLSSLSFANTTEFLAFPERVRATAEEYNYERALHLVNLPEYPDVWKDLRWRVSYTGCAEWVDTRLRIGTGNKRCGLAPCPGRSVAASDNFFSGEVVQAGRGDGQAASVKESEASAIVTEPKCRDLIDANANMFPARVELHTGGYPIPDYYKYEELLENQANQIYDKWDPAGERNSKVVKKQFSPEALEQVGLVLEMCWREVTNVPGCYVFLGATDELAGPGKMVFSLPEKSDANYYPLVHPVKYQWTGECKNGVVHGEGTMARHRFGWSDIWKNEGPYKEGKRQGKGIRWGLHSDRSCEYSGKYENGLKQGRWSLSCKYSDDEIDTPPLISNMYVIYEEGETKECSNELLRAADELRGYFIYYLDVSKSCP